MICRQGRLQAWAKPTQMTVFPTQSKLDKDWVIFIFSISLKLMSY